MTTAQPDIEIYVKRAEVEDIRRWLENNFIILEQKASGDTLKLSMTFDNQPLTCTIFEKAAKGGYVSILFEPNHTPWDTDETCALDAFSFFQLEVRCSVGSWTASTEDTGGWYRFTESGKSTVNWLT